MEGPRFLVGQLLLAMPGIGDPRFEHAVIAMCSHDEDGALGIGIGAHVPGIGLHALMRQLGLDPGVAPDAPLHVGGPVEPNRGFVIHTDDWAGEGSIDVAGRWRLTSTLDVLRAIAEGRGPQKWLAALGYAGWSAGQLDNEMVANGWFGIEGNDELVFGQDASHRWSAGFATAGVDVRMLSASSGHA
ncbi:MAG TPA: YqgE/AlgH family protein [Reyranella sp.]|nr:YqgE/AlgH family protein [Reyranella sp.]